MPANSNSTSQEPDWQPAAIDPLPTQPPPPLDQALLAYEDSTFLDSSEGRPVRILAEYAEPMARFRAQRIEDTVVLFGSARIGSRETAAAALAAADAPARPAAETALAMSAYYEDARTFARLHAAWARTLPGPRHRFVITSGGGPGIMEAANRGAWEVGAKTIGLNITLPFEQRPNPYITPELSFNFHYFFMRKFWFASLAKALVIFPGGFGTLDEAFEILTLAQTGKLKPSPLGKRITIILYGSAYWNSILNLESMATHGTVSPSDLDLFHFADTPESAFAILQHELSTHHLQLPADPADSPTPDPTPAPSPQRLLGPDIARSR